ncbi:glycosyltransferase family 4 protein [Mesorhizobium sp. B2-5-7]|uniref:glycosyltransferase family 4 protein n=1 Tax=Mesorhizobium sp. B2-5-7 TaxID=2589923 RepID=UPI00112BD67B|nr:glycosyltransferase family 4 protein [Mesorhizobium sp. B2-5-7]TPK10432.1 glycosyltransferase family 4 protein [Mesorhizobium sp. B2-5-7]
MAQREGLLHDQVQYLGVVKNLAPHYASARLVAMPIIAGVGIAIKALEALAAGRPIVASPLGFRGLPPDFQHLRRSRHPMLLNSPRQSIGCSAMSKRVTRRFSPCGKLTRLLG